MKILLMKLKTWIFKKFFLNDIEIGWGENPKNRNSCIELLYQDVTMWKVEASYLDYIANDELRYKQVKP